MTAVVRTSSFLVLRWVGAREVSLLGLGPADFDDELVLVPASVLVVVVVRRFRRVVIPRPVLGEGRGEFH